MNPRNRHGRRRPTSIRDLPAAHVTWEGHAAPLRDFVPSIPDEWGDPRVVLWCELETGTVVASGLVDPETLPGAAARMVVDAMRRPASGEPRRPATLAVRDPELARAVEDRTDRLDIAVVRVSRLAMWHDVASDLGAFLAARGPERSYLEAADPDDVADLFDAAAEYYRRSPWGHMDDDQPLELRLEGRDAPVYAVVLGGAGITHGLGVYRSLDDLTELLTGGSADSSSPNVLAVTFVAEGELSRTMAEERGAHRWPVASPSAFPLPFRSSSEGVAIVDGEDFRMLASSLRAVGRFVREHRGTLRSGGAVEAPIDVGGSTVRVRYPVPLPGRGAAPADPWGETPPGEGGRTLLFDEMLERTHRLPGAEAILRRLAWSFFLAPGPIHAGPGEHELGAALARFTEWAVFAARAEGRTLAERALDAAEDEDTLTDSQLAERRRFSRPHYSFFRVTRVRRGRGIDAHDLMTGRNVRIRERKGSFQVERGAAMVGPIFDAGGGAFVLGGGMALFRSALQSPEEVPEEDPEEFAAALERVVFGASLEWIREIADIDELTESWGEFRDDLAGTGTRLPELAVLQDRIATAELPSEVLQPLLDTVDLWNVREAELLGAFFMRTWNLTPRPELGGLSPDERLAGEGEGPQRR